MKKTYNKIFTAIIACTLLVSCNDDFMQQDPMALADGSFLKTESELPIYLDQFYKIFFQGHGHGWGLQRGAPWYNDMNKGSAIIYGDLYTDNMIMTGSANNEITNLAVTPPSAEGLYAADGNGAYANAWHWEQMRNINYFIRNYKQAEASASSPAALDKWLAEAYYFKAKFYYEKLVLFGGVPWFDRDLTTTSPELHKAQDPRELVADSIASLLEFSVKHIRQLSSAPSPTGRVHIDDVNFLKAQFGLFEGTFRKYHMNDETASKRFLLMAEEASLAIIESKRYTLSKGSATGKHYRDLFTMADGKTSTETIRARIYTGEAGKGETGHANPRYGLTNTVRNSIGAPLGLVEDYLCADGKPIYSAGTEEGSYVNNPLFAGYTGLWNELNNRDPRLTQTINKPGEDLSIYKRGPNVVDAALNGVSYPTISYSSTEFDQRGSTVTGYSFIKHIMLDFRQWDVATRGTQTAHIARYAEVLLIYAEAKAVMGTINSADIEMTVNELRLRAGFDFSKYPSARLTISPVADTRLDAILAKSLDYSITPILREIRRERRVELVMENKRYEDIVRWKAGKLLEVPLKGMKVEGERKNLYDGTNEKGSKVNAEGYKIFAKKAVERTDYFLDDNDFIIVYPNTANFGTGVFPWADYRYYRPIPRQQLVANPNLTPSPGWK